MLQKRAKAAYFEHTNPLFLKPQLLKMQGLAKWYNAVHVQSVLLCISCEQSKYVFSYRGFGNFVVPMAGSTRRFSMSLCGVTWWNNLGPELKQCQIAFTISNVFKNKRPGPFTMVWLYSCWLRFDCIHVVWSIGLVFLGYPCGNPCGNYFLILVFPLSQVIIITTGIIVGVFFCYYTFCLK